MVSGLLFHFLFLIEFKTNMAAMESDKILTVITGLSSIVSKAFSIAIISAVHTAA